MAPILPEPRHLVVRDLQPREPLVVTHAELPKAERAHEGLGGVDAPQLLRRDGVAVLEARGQAGERGLVPRRQSERARELADLLLGEPGVDHRRAHAALLRGLHARPVVAEIVDVRAVHQRTAAFALGDRRELSEQLLFAEEAAVGGILRVLRVGQLRGADDDVAQADQRRQPLRLG